MKKISDFEEVDVKMLNAFIYENNMSITEFSKKMRYSYVHTRRLLLGEKNLTKRFKYKFYELVLCIK